MAAGSQIDSDGRLTDPIGLLSAAVDQLLAEPGWQLSDDDLLLRIDQVRCAETRLAGARLRLIGEAEQRKVCEARGSSLDDHLVSLEPQARATARGTVALAGQLTGFPHVADAVCAGRVSVAQARAITRSLTELAPDVDAGQVARAEQVMVEHARRFDAAALARIGNHLVDVLCPDPVEDRLGRQLTRQEARAHKNRFLSWKYTGDGSVDFHGRLPVLAAETFICLVDAYTISAHSSGLDRTLDPGAEPLTGGQRRADAWVAMTEALQAGRHAPTVAGDRPRVIIALQYADLVAGIRGGSLLGSGQPIAPGTARRLACAGDILPAVLDGPSTVLDIGRAARLFSGALRTALLLRDGGCVFPGCDAPPSRCEGHHLVPWWAGGPTSLTNGILVCRHHHDLVEPDPHAAPGSRWQVRLDQHGLPEVLPPSRVDPHQRPRQHARFAERSLRRRR